MPKHTRILVRIFGVALVAAVGTAIWFRGGVHFDEPGKMPSAERESRASFEPMRASAEVDWPTLRGPRYDGHSGETSLIEKWPEKGPPVLWTRSLGQGYSAFVARGNRVYTQYQSLAGQFVICLNADTGVTVWEYRYDWPYEAAGVYPGPRATPTLAEGRVYFAAPSGLIGCLSDGGKLLWSVNVVQQFKGRGAEFGYSCSPVVEAGRVLVPAGGRSSAMVALDARDGTILWQAGDDAASYTPALPISVDGHRQVIGYLENVLAAFDFESGLPLWRLDLSQGYDEHAAWPVYVEPYLWISAPFRSGSQLLKLSGGDHAAVETVWRSTLLSNDVCSSVFHEGFLYGFDLRDVQAKTHRPSRGHFRCLDLASGDERWASDRTGQASVLVADGKLILFNDKGELILARATSERYEELARSQVFGGEICWTPPALHRGRLYLRTHSQAACLYLGTADLLPTAPDLPTLTVADIPRSADWRWESILGVEPEFAFDVPSLRWLRNWYIAGLSILCGVATLVQIVMVGSRLTRRQPIRAEAAWFAFWMASFVLGAVATTPLSLWKGEFVFTWPVPLFVAFHATMFHARLRRNDAIIPSSRWRERAVAAMFLIVCVAYYMLCRRLSLVFEWVYLCGFVAAVPVSIGEQQLVRRGWNAPLVHAVFLPLGFTAYYWTSVGLLFWKYQISWHD